MKVKGNVLNSSVEERELVNKDGVKRQSKISHVLLLVDGDNGSKEVANVRSYDAAWALPKIGDKWESPRILTYKCYDGNVAEIMV